MTDAEIRAAFIKEAKELLAAVGKNPAAIDPRESPTDAEPRGLARRLVDRALARIGRTRDRR